MTLLLMMMALGLNASAQDSTRHITLQEAVSLSIQNSNNLKISRARIDEATATLLEANNNRLPDFKVSGSYLRLNSANVQLKTKSDSGNSGGGGININQALYGTANLSLPIYSGGRIRFAIESAKFLKRATELDAEQDREEIVFNTTQAYLNFYKSFEAVLLVQQNLQSSLSRDTVFSNLEKNGLLARNDMLKARLQTSNIELSLLDAQTNNKLAMVNLNLMLGLPEQTTISIDTTFLLTPIQVKAFNDYEDLALKNRKDVQSLGLRQQAAAISIKSAKAQAYPGIVLTAGYAAVYVPNFVTVTNALNAGIGIQYNLANLYKKNSVLAQAKARQAEVTAREAILADNIRSSITRDYEEYLLSEKKIEVYENALEQATENYRITRNKYNNSLVTITDLLDADVALLQARLNISFAKADEVLAYNKLQLQQGHYNKLSITSYIKWKIKQQLKSIP